MILCLVTDRRRRPVLDQARDAIGAGVDLIQIREPDLEGAALCELASAVARMTLGTPTRVVVNDRLDVALVSGAHGVHLRGDSIPASRARTMVPPGFLVGCSVRGVDDAVESAHDADYLIAGTVFPTSSKPGLRQHLGVEGLAAIARAVRVPVLGIGGMTADRIEAVSATGAAGIAAIGLFDAEAPALTAALQDVRQRFDRVRSAS